MGKYILPFAPLQPSSLRILSGPSSPTSPLSSQYSNWHLALLHKARINYATSRSLVNGKELTGPPIQAPMPWIWSCHRCHSRYPLGATRRCLQDGHFFCGGMSTDKLTGKKKRHRACSSEFDYLGWEEIGHWQRAFPCKSTAHRIASKGCQTDCDYPSACQRSRRRVVEATNSDFLDPACMDIEPSVAGPTSAPPSLENTSSFRGKIASVDVDKLLYAAEKRTTQLSALLSTIEEEVDSPAIASMKRTAEEELLSLEPARLNDLAMNDYVLDSQDRFRRNSSVPNRLYIHEFPSGRDVLTGTNQADWPPPLLTSRIEDVSEKDEDMNMTDWVPECRGVPFDFSQESAPISPGENTWDWNAGHIGIALSTPHSPDEEMLDVGLKMAVEANEGTMSGDIGSAGLRRVDGNFSF